MKNHKRIMMRNFMYALLLLPVIASAQLSSGIRWTTGLNWEQVKQKAKQENKYIFLDIFATWCGPCKEMDKRVYVNDSVGDFFNNQFLSVKVQTDQTPNDNEQVKNWYADAQVISKEYRVLGLPTYVFLSPSGNIVHKTTGYRSVQKFIEEARIALLPGQVYSDPYNEYDELEADYYQSKKDYGRMLYMIRSAHELGRTNIEKLLVKDYCQYLESETGQQLYTLENMEFLEEVEIKSDSKLFAAFYPYGKKADKAVGKKGFSKRMVNRVILREIVYPFLQLKAAIVPFRSDGKVVGSVDGTEANWNLLYAKIREKYP
ncbi:MAG: DUF255 domain-containing protein, partial [Chitinophagaceae bacterium]|nr:DUF255 domain-containing protein [Chitinophagaceae bacterium]